MTSRTLAEAFSRMAPHRGALPFSYSRAQTLERCPLQFELQYRSKGIARGAPSGNDDTRVGWIAHKILECTVKNIKATGILTPAGGSFDSEFERWASTADNDAQTAVLAEFKESIRASLEKVLSFADDESSFFVERELQFGRDGSHRRTIGRTWYERSRGRSDLGLSGYVDLEIKRGGELLLFDWKTEMPSVERSVCVTKQLALYAFCELEARPAVDSVATHCVYLKNAQVDRMGAYSRGESLDSLRSDMAGWLGEYASALESFRPDRKEGAHCSYCPYSWMCGGARE